MNDNLQRRLDAYKMKLYAVFCEHRKGTDVDNRGGRVVLQEDGLNIIIKRVAPETMLEVQKRGWDV